MAAEPVSLAAHRPGRAFFPGRSASLSSQIVADVRDALLGKRLKPGEVIGTENEIAQRYGVSRIVARDALRTLEALGIAEIKMGKGGGARVARGNPRLFAEALAVQLDLTGVGPAEIMDAQRAIECLSAELAAEHATDQDIARLRVLLAEAESSMDDVGRFTELGAAFHLAVAEASHNRVLVVQLISLQHVSWPRRNPTLTPKVAQRILDVHRDLLKLIEIHDPSGARQLMDDHVKMIRARRVSEHGRRAQDSQPSFRGAPKARTRNPGPQSTAPGFRARRFAAPRNDDGEGGSDCC
jgi:GntR family transcriptional repressor for pyruvate dehydrogenase complex